MKDHGQMACGVGEKSCEIKCSITFIKGRGLLKTVEQGKYSINLYHMT